MKNHLLLGSILLASAALVINLPCQAKNPYNNPALNQIAVQDYMSVQAQKGVLPYGYSPYGYTNPYTNYYANPYSNYYSNPYANYVNPYANPYAGYYNGYYPY